MRWYDIFSTFYDASSTKYYVEQHASALGALELEPEQVVLDLPCGTGQAFDTLVPALGAEGLLLGIDYSDGMLAEARKRATKHGWDNVRLHQADVHDVDQALLDRMAGREVQLDRLHVFLGMSVFPDYPAAFEKLWALLRPGGRCVVVDIHAPEANMGTKVTKLMTRGDILRRWWEPFEAVASDFSRTPLPSLPEHGGTIYLCSGTKG